MYELNEEDRYYASLIEANRDMAYPYYLRIRANPLDMIYIPNDVIRMEVINHFNIKYATPPAWLYGTYQIYESSEVSLNDEQGFD
jgi:hypothetical protein